MNCAVGSSSSAPQLGRNDGDWWPASAGKGLTAATSRAGRQFSSQGGSLTRPLTGLLSQAAVELIKTPGQGGLGRPPSNGSMGFGRPSSRSALEAQRASASCSALPYSCFDRPGSKAPPTSAGRSLGRAVRTLDKQLSSAFRELEASQELEATTSMPSIASPPGGGRAATASSPPHRLVTHNDSPSGQGNRQPAPANMSPPSSPMGGSSSSWRRAVASAATILGEGMDASDGLDDYVPKRRRQPSRRARRENFKKEHYVALAEEVQAASRAAERENSGLGPTSESVQLIPSEVFNDDLRDLQERMNQMHKKLTTDSGGKTAAEAKRQAAEEAERKRIEDEQRRLRKKEQESRTPKKKVALKVQAKRLYGIDDEKDKVPMISLTVEGKDGPEMVNVVDIKCVQSKCMMLEVRNASVADLVEHSETRRKIGQLKLLASSRPGTTDDGTASWSSSMVRPVTHEERLRRCKERREADEIQKTLGHIATMRGGDKHNGFGEIAKQAKMARKMQASMGSDGEESPNEAFDWAKSLGVRGGNLQGLLTVVETKKVAHQGKRRPGTATLRKKGPATLAVKDQATDDEAKKAARRRLAIFKAAVKCFCLFREVQSRNKSMMLVTSFMSQFGEWSRMKMAMKKTMKSVRLMQAAVKEFVHNMRKRTKIMEGVFMRVEDTELQRYFTALTQLIIKEQQKKVIGRLGSKNCGSMTRLMEGGDISDSQMAGVSRKQKKALEEFKMFGQMADTGVGLDWKQFRISTEDRQKLLRSYYTYRMRKKVRFKEQFANMLHELVQSNRDLQEYFRTFGAETTTTKGLLHDPKGPEDQQSTKYQPTGFWHLSEGTAVLLIGFAAECIGGSDSKHPMYEHPANQDQLANRFRPVVLEEKKAGAPRGCQTRGGQKGDAVLAGVAARVDRALIRRDPAASRGQTKDLSSRRASTASGADGGGVAADAAAATDSNPAEESNPSGAQVVTRQIGVPSLEEVFERFTPRLREIVEDQAQRYRGDPRGGNMKDVPRVPTPPIPEGMIA